MAMPSCMSTCTERNIVVYTREKNCQAEKGCLLFVSVLTSLLVFLEMNLRAASDYQGYILVPNKILKVFSEVK